MAARHPSFLGVEPPKSNKRRVSSPSAKLAVSPSSTVQVNFEKRFLLEVLRQEVVPWDIVQVLVKDDFDEEVLVAMCRAHHPSRTVVGQVYQQVDAQEAFRAALLNSSCDFSVVEMLLERADIWKADGDGLNGVDDLIYSIQLGNSKEFGFRRLQDLLRVAKPPSLPQWSPIVVLLTLSTSLTSNVDTVERTCRKLLHWDASLATRTSKVTSCSPLQVAIRNYGDRIEIVKLFLNEHNMKHRNRLGDLPIHVACSVGVPAHVLKCLLQAANDYATSFPNPLIWDKGAKHGPIDLEWIRNIEQGRHFCGLPRFNPIDWRGIQIHRHEELYNRLLRESVDLVLSDDTLGMHNTGHLLDRISWIIAGSFGECLEDDLLLHRTCRLSNHIPVPILDLILHYYKHQASQMDDNGCLPLHYAASQCTDEAWLTALVRAHPSGCRSTDNRGAFALHHSFQNPTATKLLLSQNPQGAEAVLENLYPFQLAAAQDADVELIYILLRHSPGAVMHCRNTD